MRLRLVVKRHDLPDAAIVWPVNDEGRLIVSQLLEEVNEVVPLESGGEWGLEDYAVEVRGKETNYECLHFQDVKSILHEDDEVIIRPLLGDDIKQRRASGRYQITSDGIHLFDGAVFGRPRRRMIESRPAVTINPRKRRRVTYTETVEDDLEDEDSDESFLRIEGAPQEIDDGGNQQLVVRADFDNDDEDESEDDGNFESADEDMDEDLSVDEGELEGELEALNAESDDDGASDKENIKHGSKMEGVQSGEKLDPKSHNIIQLQEAFPDAPPSICEQVMQNCDMDVGAAYDTLSKGFKPGRSKTAVRSMMWSPSQTVKAPRSSRVQARSVEVVEQEADLVAEDGDQVDEENDEEDEEEGSDEEDDGGMAGYYDSHGLPPGSINIGKGLSDIAKSTLAQATNIPLPPSRHSVLRRSDSPSSSKSVRFVEDTVVVHDPDAIALDDDSDDEDDEDFDVAGQSESDSGSSSDSSDSDDEMEISTAPAVPTTEVAEDLTSSSGSDDSSSSESESESSSDSDSDSDSSSDSEPEVASSKAPVQPKAPTTSKSAASFTKKDTPKTVPPGEGRNSTKARNQRRRSGNILQRFKEKGILPAGVTLAEFGKLDIDSTTTPEAAAEALAIARSQIEEEEAMGLRATKGKSSKKANKEAEFEARRQELLASLSAGGVDVGATLSNGKAAAKTPNETGPNHLADQASPVPASTDKDLTSSASAKKKSKVDVDAGRRLLFGALGIKNPKTKADEENIRNKLMKDVRKVKEPEPEVPVVAEEEEDMDNTWREKITLRAVECCQEGIELSEPPFPFVQRWDPQQQHVYRKGKRGGKGKRNQRNQPEYYEEEEQASAKKQKRNHDSNGYDDYTEYSEEGQNSGDFDQYDGADGQADDHVMEDSQGVHSEPADENDLPALPADTSSLSDINPKDMKPGMVVAFKQLIMSEATSWQPVISEFRTAVVNIVSDKNEVELTLAIRDREYPERYYNQETGDRIYGKFDMPVEDEEEEEDLDDGFRALGFAELMEPKLVQAEPENLRIDGLPEAVSDKVTTSTDESTTLAHEQHDAPNESIETPQVADEDRISVQDLHQVQTEDDSPPRLPSEQVPDTQYPAEVDDEMVDVSITEESREEISVLMRQAGFRSDIPTSVLKNRPQLPDTPSDDSELKRLALSMNVSLNKATTPEDSSQPFHVEDEDNSTPTQSNFYPKILVPSSLASQTSDHGQRQPDFPTPGESTLDRFGDSNSFPLSQDGFSLGSAQAEPLTEEPQLPSIQPSHAAAAPEAPPSERESSVLDFPSLDEMFSTARSSFAAKQDDPQPVIAPPSTSLGGNKSYEEAMAKLDAELDARADPDQNSGDITPRARSEDLFVSQLVEEVHQQSNSANGATRGRSPELPSQKLRPNSSPFVIPSGSQQVDLTLSSDGDVAANVESDDDDGEYDHNMPRGPGWVRKRKMRRRTGGSTSNSQASGSRTRSQRRRRATMGV
ncbi:hypothetical protein VF21_01252 [Pseudogymnoascus sp. 05NY08]|nr:hypothetical protein VF21_01252 [Pseudogymnoascus sp. 05NY08]